MKKAREGYKMTELGEIPKEWEVVNVGDILKVRHGKSQHDVVDENGDIPILGTGGQIGWANKYLYDKPSVLIGRKGTINKPQYIERPFWTIDTLFYTEITNKVFPKYVFYYFQTINWYMYNEATGVPSLSSSTIESIKIPLSTIPEQQKIADILSTVDEQIENVDNLIEKTKELKKGLMQRLLTKGIGHKEFKKTEVGFIPKEWEVNIIDKYFNINNHSIIPTAYDNEEVLYYSIPAYDEKRAPEITLANQIKSSKFLIKKDSLLVSKLNPRIQRIWNVKKIDGFKQVCSTEFIVYEPKKNNVDIKYFYYYFSSDSFQEELLKRETGTTGSRKRVSPNLTREILVPIPPIPEQQKIADILSSVDDQLEEYQAKKEKLELLKKGLMQKLLTGKIRVKI